MKPAKWRTCKLTTALYVDNPARQRIHCTQLLRKNRGDDQACTVTVSLWLSTPLYTFTLHTITIYYKFVFFFFTLSLPSRTQLFVCPFFLSVGPSIFGLALNIMGKVRKDKDKQHFPISPTSPMSGSDTSSDIMFTAVSDPTSTPPPCQVTEELSKDYYKGLPSRPRLVATTRPGPFEKPIGPEAYTIYKELRILGDHPLARVWEDNLAFQLHRVLNSSNVNWTSTDVVRIANIEESFSFVVVWVGVEPGTLSFDDGVVVALKCREVLDSYHIQDVEVEIRESRIIKQAGPRFLDPVLPSNPTVTAREPYTATLGIPISAKSMPWAKGTGGFYISAGGNDNKIYLVTARHVVLPLDKDTNVEWKCNGASEARYDVVVLGNSAFDKKLSSIDTEVRRQADNVESSQRRIDAVAGRKDSGAVEGRRDAEYELRRANQAIKGLTELHNDIATGWATLDDRVFGHLVWSPPINLSENPGQYTQDFAVIEIHAGKLDAKNYGGNTINLSSKYRHHQFIDKMNPNPTSRTNFKLPFDRLMKLQGHVPELELYNPPTLDQYNEPCLAVYKNGAQTGVTIGYGNNVCSYTRNCFEGEYTMSKEWPILSDDCSPWAVFPLKVFSTKGDSGSIIGDGFGRMCGLITGGAGGLGDTDYYDITFATPIEYIMKVLHTTETFKDAHLNPVLPAEEGLAIDSCSNFRWWTSAR